MTDNKSINSKFYFPLLFFMIASIGMVIGYQLGQDGNNRKWGFAVEDTENYVGRVEEVIRHIESRYVDSIDSEHLLNVATHAILNELDPHSLYIEPMDLESINDRMNGNYIGLGLETIVHNDSLTIVRVLKDSPAELVGLNYGDQIISVNDMQISGVELDVEDMRSSLKSDKNESLQLQVLKLSGQVSLVDVVPSKVNIPNVEFKKLEENIGYINIHRFSDHTFDEVVKALESFQEDLIIEDLILDLRNNPGGYLPEATKILNQLFEEDKRLLVYTEGINSRKSEYKTTGRPFFRINKIIVLINENSASASEIIAGALQDWDKAIVIGQPSFGKGLVQEQYNLQNGGALRLTIARYFTPSGRYIQVPFDRDGFQSDSLGANSIVLERPLPNNGGIYPDILIHSNEFEQNLVNELQPFLNDYAYQIIKKHQLQNFDDSYTELIQEDIQLFSNNILDTLQRNVNFNSPNVLDRVSQELEIKIAEHLNRESIIIQNQLDYDPFLKQAIDVLKGESIMAELQNLN